MLITIEGIDGAGKTTIALKLYEYLKREKGEVYLFREPGSTEVGEKIREILLMYNVSDITELLLFESARAELTERLLLPLLEKGKIVILDRFYDSTTAYQGYGRGIDIEMIERINMFASKGIKPDLTILLDISPEVALERLRAKDRFEEIDFLRKVREGFLKIAEKHGRIKVIKADEDIDTVFKNVLGVVKEHLC